jgi:hypothetical protein
LKEKTGSSDRVWGHISTPRRDQIVKTMWEMNNNRNGGELPPILRMLKKGTTPLTGDQRKKGKKKKEKKKRKKRKKRKKENKKIKKKK